MKRKIAPGSTTPVHLRSLRSEALSVEEAARPLTLWSLISGSRMIRAYWGVQKGDYSSAYIRCCISGVLCDGCCLCGFGDLGREELTAVEGLYGPL